MSFFSSLRTKTAYKLLPSFIHRHCVVFVDRKPYRRAFQIYVDTKGELHTVCALRTPLKEIKSFLNQHWPWVQKQMEEQKKRKKQYPTKTFREGEEFLFQGKKHQLKYQKAKAPLDFFSIQQNSLIYFWRSGEDLNNTTLKQRLREFYQAQGVMLIQQAVDKFSSRMRLFPKTLRIGAQKSLWGACSSAGRISLNWRLVVAPLETLHYVVIHELAHLKHLNHSPRFWSLVAEFCPDYKQHEHWLKKNSGATNFLTLI